MSTAASCIFFIPIAICISLATIVRCFEEVDPHYRLGPHHVSKRDVDGTERESPWLNTDWNALGRKRIKMAKTLLENSRNTKRAKNVILFIGDGMGLPSISAGRVLKAQVNNLKGEDIYLAWEKFPHAGLARTYNVDRTTADSAGTATAYLSGMKANYGTIGVNEKVKVKDCSNIEGNKLKSILHKSIDAGKWTGVVTTTRITHASPAGCYASTPSRNWESTVPRNVTKADKCSDIAYQLVHEDRNKDIRVIFGGGSLNFLPNSSFDEVSNKTGLRTDDRNLLEEWLSMKRKDSKKAVLLRNRTEFDSFDPMKMDFVFGLFQGSHLSYEVDRKPNEEPSLSEMTEAAIRMLNRSPNGFFLFVEGGRIDHAHHNNNAYRALYETLALEKAVEAALKLTNPEETLVLVTADHSHVFNLGGYARFEESIFGFADSDEEPPLDKKAYTQLMYANGPGFAYHRIVNGSEKPRKNLTNEVHHKDFLQDAGIWLELETHGGEDVAVYASGPWSHLFQGTEEQSYVAHVMMYASCVGQYLTEDHCNCSTTFSKNIFHFIHLLSFWIFLNVFTTEEMRW